MMVYKSIRIAALTVFLGLATICNAWAIETAQLRAKISDISGKPLEGVKIFLYESINVRKPADFITSPSDAGGRVNSEVPPGKYWAVARLKKDSLYGPLMPGDRHSGEPLELEITREQGVDAEFTVADIREIGQKKRTDAALTKKIQGRILDADGKPVTNAFVFANRSKSVDSIPDYLSAWSDENGRYTLVIPQTELLFIGAARSLPLVSEKQTLKELATGPTKSDIALDIQLIVY